MAAAAIDIKAQATYPIRLGVSILKPSKADRFTSVRYNHKPRLTPSDSLTATIRDGDDEGESKLLLKDEASEYNYRGTHSQDDGTYVLVVRSQGKDRAMFMERMSGSFGFNLLSTPSEGNAAKLNGNYAPLPLHIEEGDLFGEDDEDTPPEESNPFDYRHFLKAEVEKHESMNSNMDVNRSAAATPIPHAQQTSTPISRPVKKAPKKAEPLKKRKTNTTEKANPKRVKAGHEPPASAAAAKPNPKPDIPKIHMDRKASTRRASVVDDDGELILENETPVTEKPPRHSAMALALSGQLGNGPISLRSAANSPGGSHAASPMPQRAETTEEPEQYVFEFDNDDGDESADDEGADADEENDADADVDEDIELPSPAQPHRPSVSGATLTGVGDEDDDLEAQLAAGLMEDAEQESEESEEE